jgi:hypothetical protein
LSERLLIVSLAHPFGSPPADRVNGTAGDLTTLG